MQWTMKLKEFIRNKEEQCVCNKILTVVNSDTIELRCDKCKRTMIIKTLGIVNVKVI